MKEKHLPWKTKFTTVPLPIPARYWTRKIMWKIRRKATRRNRDKNNCNPLCFLFSTEKEEKKKKENQTKRNANTMWHWFSVSSGVGVTEKSIDLHITLIFLFLPCLLNMVVCDCSKYRQECSRRKRRLISSTFGGYTRSAALCMRIARLGFFAYRFLPVCLFPTEDDYSVLSPLNFFFTCYSALLERFFSDYLSRKNMDTAPSMHVRDPWCFSEFAFVRKRVGQI